MDVVSLTLFAWIPLSLFLFTQMKPVAACTVAILAGWLLLPMAQVRIAGLPDIDKVFVTSVGASLGVAMFGASATRGGLRFCFCDLLFVIFSGSIVMTSLVNETGIHDAMAQWLLKVLMYGVPYFLGRLVLKSRPDFHQACYIVVCGTALYAIPALWEWRMSPNIHLTVYGFFQHGFATTPRWGAFRPIVCFQAPLAIGTFFAWTAILAVALYRGKLMKPLLGAPPFIIVAAVLLGLLVSMSLGPWGMFLLGMAMLWAWYRHGWRRTVLFPILFSMLWIGIRYTDSTGGEAITSTIAVVAPLRAESFNYRLRAEGVQLELARQKPIWGFGGFGRSRVQDENGDDVVAVDGLWIIYLSAFGFAGLLTFLAWWSYPLVMASKMKLQVDRDPVLGAIIVSMSMQLANFMFNAFVSSVLIFLMGGAITQLLNLRHQARAPQPVKTSRGVVRRPATMRASL